MEFIPGQVKLSFKPETHQYFHNNIEFCSVSKLIERYKNPFDPNGEIIARKAAENGITIEEQRARWKKINEESIIRGHSFHSDLESYIKTKKIPKTDNEDIIRQFSKIKFKGMLFSEVRLWNLEYRIAGTTDLIELLPNKSINLLDLKTNKNIRKFSWKKRMLPPLDYYWDANYYHYSIQLEIYKFMLEEAGWWVNSTTLLYIDPQTNLLTHIPVQARREDILNVLEHHRETYLEKSE